MTILKPTGTEVRQVRLLESTEIRVDEGIPIPSRPGKSRHGLALKVEGVLHNLQVGQSFVSPISPSATRSILGDVTKKTGAKFVSRTVTEGREKGVRRIWRVE